MNHDRVRGAFGVRKDEPRYSQGPQEKIVLEASRIASREWQGRSVRGGCGCRRKCWVKADGHQHCCGVRVDGGSDCLESRLGPSARLRAFSHAPAPVHSPQPSVITYLTTDSQPRDKERMNDVRCVPNRIQAQLLYNATQCGARGIHSRTICVCTVMRGTRRT